MAYLLIWDHLGTNHSQPKAIRPAADFLLCIKSFQIYSVLHIQISVFIYILEIKSFFEILLF